VIIQISAVITNACKAIGRNDNENNSYIEDSVIIVPPYEYINGEKLKRINAIVNTLNAISFFVPITQFPKRDNKCSRS